MSRTWAGGSMGFDRTYEGLKHISLVRVNLQQPGFDRTYEGLKHFLGYLH